MDLSGVILTAAGLFAATNIDGFITLMVLFWISVGGVLRPWHIIAGQFLGFTVIVVVSGLAAAGLVRLPGRWEGLVGVLPITLGVWSLIRARKDRAEELPLANHGVIPVIGLVLANGVDNIAVYTPLFAISTADQITVSVVVFFVMVAMWCAGAWLLGRSKRTVTALASAGKWIAPAVLILIGLGILLKTGVLARIVELL